MIDILNLFETKKSFGSERPRKMKVSLSFSFLVVLSNEKLDNMNF